MALSASSTSLIFGAIRHEPNKNEIIARIKRFLYYRIPESSVRPVSNILNSNDLTDVQILTKIRELAAGASGQTISEGKIAAQPPKLLVPGTPPPTPSATSSLPIALALRLPPPLSPASAPPPPLGDSGKTRESSRVRDCVREMAIVKNRMKDISRPQYLDVGCAEGKITEAIANALGLPPGDVFACDTEPQPSSGRFTFTRCGPIALPYEDQKFDLVTMFMSAHHFSDAVGRFCEVHRVLKPGGYLLIREHDCETVGQKLYYDVIHALYDCVFGDRVTPAEFMANYAKGGFASYRSTAEWVSLAAKCGFAPEPNVKPHGPWVKNKYGTDSVDTTYIFLVRK